MKVDPRKVMAAPNNLWLRIYMLILIVGLLVTACRRSEDVHTSTDLNLVNAVRASFAVDHDTQGATRGVEVHAMNGVVTLTGRVDTESDKALAERLARNVSGVTNVINQIGVASPQSATDSLAWNEQRIRAEAAKNGEKIGPDTEDARIYDAVRRALVAHEGTFKQEIFVDVVSRNVTLRGKFIGTSSARDEAIAAAKNIRGVNAVNDEMMVSATGTSSP